MDLGNNEDTKHNSGVPSRNPMLQDVLQAIAALKAQPIPIFCATISPAKGFVTTGIIKRQANLIAFGEENVLNLMPLNSSHNILNIKDNIEGVKFTDHSGTIYSIDLCSRNIYLATGSADQTLCIYDLNNMRRLHKCEGHLGPIYVVKISSNSEYVATGSADQTVRIWETSSGKTLRIFVGHSAAILCLDFHPNCLYVASGSSDRTIHMWCMNKGITIRRLQGCNANVVSVSYSPTGKYIVSASEDKKILLWDLITSAILIELKYDGAPVYRMLWDKTGTELCTGSNDATVRIWDVRKIEDNNWDAGKTRDPSSTRKLAGRLLHLEYDFGTYAALTSAEEY